jgi:hypothetical protein
MSRIGRGLVDAERMSGEVLAAMLRAFSAALADRGGDGEGALNPAMRQRLASDVWELRAAFDEISAASGTRQAMHDLAAVIRAAAGRVVSFVELIDTLTDEAERLYGTASGRGEYKRQQVKAALLYAARRGGYDVPLVPSFIEPLLFSLGADLLIDFTVAQVNQNALWNKAALPARPPLLRHRLAPPLLFGLRRWVERLSALLAGLSWRLVLGANRLSPSMRAAADRLAPPDRDMLRRLAALRDFLRANPRFVPALATMFSIGTQQAELLQSLTGAQKQAYVRELVMAVLRQNGLVGVSPLWDRIVEGLVSFGIDATVAIFNRRNLFR